MTESPLSRYKSVFWKGGGNLVLSSNMTPHGILSFFLSFFLQYAPKRTAGAETVRVYTYM